MEKNKAIKKILSEYIKSRGLRPSITDPYDGWAEINEKELEAMEADRLNMTMKDFDLVYESMRAEANYYRMKSIYCYDIQDHPDYKIASKTSKKISKLAQYPISYVWSKFNWYTLEYNFNN